MGKYQVWSLVDFASGKPPVNDDGVWLIAGTYDCALSAIAKLNELDRNGYYARIELSFSGGVWSNG